MSLDLGCQLTVCNRQDHTQINGSSQQKPAPVDSRVSDIAPRIVHNTCSGQALTILQLMREMRKADLRVEEVGLPAKDDSLASSIPQPIESAFQPQKLLPKVKAAAAASQKSAVHNSQGDQPIANPVNVQQARSSRTLSAPLSVIESTSTPSSPHRPHSAPNLWKPDEDSQFLFDEEVSYLQDQGKL